MKDLLLMRVDREHVSWVNQGGLTAASHLFSTPAADRGKMPLSTPHEEQIYGGLNDETYAKTA